MRHQFSTENQTAAQKTYRAWQHNTPLCYRLIFNNHIATVNKRILDYGCGPDAKYVTRMLALGMNAVGIDFGIPSSREMHLNPGQTYDIIVASNVLNVMNNLPDLQGVIQEIHTYLAPAGQAIANYPADPRKLGLSNAEMLALLQQRFSVTKIDKSLVKNNFVVLLTKK